MNPVQTQIVKSLFRLAWVDGEASDAEVTVLAKLMERIGLPLSERLAVMDENLSDPEIVEGELEAFLPDHPSRLDAMEMMIAVCFSDQQLAPQEMDFLHSMAVRLGIKATELDQLRVRALRTLSE